MNLRELWEAQVARRQEHEFMQFIDSASGASTSFTYAEFDARVNQTANLLLARKIAKGARVGLLLRNRAEMVEWILAVAKIGAIIVPISPALTDYERKRLLEKARISLLAVDSCVAATLPQELPHNPGKIIIGYGSDLREADAYPTQLLQYRPIAASDLCEIMFTSGTTSCPKGVMLTHANFIFSGRYVNWQLAMQETDRYATAMLSTHVNFQLSALAPVITAGATLIFMSRYSASKFLRFLRESKATLAQGMSMIAKTLLDRPQSAADQDHHLRLMHYFLPIPTSLKEKFEKRFKMPLINNYGLTETLVGVTTDLPYEQRNWPSIGQEGLGYEVCVVRSDGSRAQANEHGEILVRGIRGLSLMAGYWEDPAATQAAFQDDWFHTGDIGYVDEQGWFFFVDRASALIKRSGENISATEVEAVLLEHPDISDVAVVGIPHEIHDEVVKAVVVPRNHTLTSEDVIAYAARKLAKFKVPALVEFRSELPRGAYGKVKKNKLHTNVGVQSVKE